MISSPVALVYDSSSAGKLDERHRDGGVARLQVALQPPSVTGNLVRGLSLRGISAPRIGLSPLADASARANVRGPRVSAQPPFAVPTHYGRNQQ